MTRLVAIGVVRMDGMGHVRRDQPGARDRAGEVLEATATAPGRVDDPAEDLEQEGPPGALSASAAHLFVVVEHDDAGGGGRSGRGGLGESREGRMARREVVQPRRVNELAPGSGSGRGLNVVRHQIPGEQVCGRWSQARRRRCRREPLAEQVSQLPRPFESQDRHEMLLGVQLEPLLAQLPVEVDREARHAQEWLVEADQMGLHALPVPQRHPPGEGEIPIEPGMQQHPAVGLHRELPVALGSDFRRGLEAQIRGVRVGADHAKARLGGRVAPELEGDQASPRPHDMMPGTRRQRPGLALLERGRAGCLQPRAGFGHGMIGSRGAIDEADQVVDGVLHGDGG